MSIFRSIQKTKFFLAVIDFAILLAVASLILFFRYKVFDYRLEINEALYFLCSAIIAIPIFREFQLYRYKIFTTGIDQIVAITKGVLWIGILQAIALFLIKDTDAIGYSRSHTLLFLLIGATMLSFFRTFIFRNIYLRLNKTKYITRKVLAIGAGSAGHALATHIQDHPQLGLTIAAFLDDNAEKIGKQLLGIKIFGPIADIKRIIDEKNINEIYIAINSIQYSRLLEIIEICRTTDLPVTVITPHFRIVHDKIDVREFSTIDSFTIAPKDSDDNMPPSWLIKRVIDVVGGFIIILLLSPLLLLIALSVKLTSSGKVFYKSEVVGKDGRLFTWFKFRTMYQNNDPKIHKIHLEKIIKENRTTEKIKDDPRITKIGKVLRKYSLDELPQLLNVLVGDMSLIGPRPCLKYEYDHFDEWHKERFKIKPGMTGMWQVFGRNKSDVTFNDSIIMDLYYIHNYTLWLDFKIILKTVPTVLFGKGGA